MKQGRIVFFVCLFLGIINSYSQGFAEFVVSFDHTTATSNRITPSLGFMCVSTGAAYDHQGNRFWFNSNPTCGLGADWDLFCIDTQTGNTLNFFPAYLAGPEWIGNLVYDNSTDTLYGIYNTGYWPSDPVLVWIDQNTGAINFKRTLPYVNSVLESELTLDENNHRLIFIALKDTFGINNRLYTLNVNTGDLIHDPYINNNNGFPIRGLTYNHADDKLYAVVDSISWPNPKLQTIDPVTFQRTTVLTLPNVSIGKFNTNTLDEDSGHYIYVSSYPEPDSIYTVDINAQTITHRIPYPFDPTGSNDTLENVMDYFYDPSEQTIFAIHYGRLSEGKPAGISEADNDFKMYPNPSSGRFTISAIHEIEVLEIFNETGQLLDRHNPMNLQMDLDLSNQPKGSYWVRISSKNDTSIRKIVIQ